MKSYQSYVTAQGERNPCLLNLCRFLASPNPKQNNCRIATLDFLSGAKAPTTRSVEISCLRSVIEGAYDINSNLLGQILLVEDLTKDVIEVLGSCLDIDPLFFATHIHAPWMEISTQTPDVATLPSRTRPRKFINIHYHRTIVLPNVAAPVRKLLRDANVYRKVVILPSTKDTRIGLAQHCCSVFKSMRTDKSWLFLVLVDPPIKDTYLSVRGQKQDLHPITLPSQLFLGGFEDFLDPPSFFDDSNHRSGPLRHALLEDLIYYWKQERPAGFNLEAPTLLSLAYYPLKIVAAEWMNYMAVMSHSIKHYEYSLEDLPGLFQESGRLAADLRALQTWRRRIMSTQHKIQSVVRFIKFHSTKDLDVDCWSFLVDDYNHLANIVDECGRRFENMLPVVTSLVQIVDSRRSFAETSNISRLTYLALVFVPLAYISSLFSMDPDVAPGGHEFWIYFVVAIPVTLAVFLIARPSVWKFLLFRNRIRRLGAPQIPV